MARSICPSCGEPFNGKQCKNCAYEVFGDIRTPELHGRRDTHVCTPSQPHTHAGNGRFPGGSPVQKKRQRKKLSASMVVILVLLFAGPLLNLVGEAVFGIINAAENISGSFSQNVSLYAEPEPEPILTDTAKVIYSDGGFTIWADWEENLRQGAVPVVVENHIDRDVDVSAQEIILQGNFLSEDSVLYIHVSRESTAKGTLYLDSASVAGIQSVSFQLCVYDGDSYDTIVETGPITLTSGEDAEPAPVPEPTDVPVTEAEGIRVYYLGLSSGPELEHFPDNALRFCLVNGTEQPLDFFTGSAQVNGQDADLSLWSVLPPHTMTYTTVYLFDLEKLDIRRKAEVESIQLHLQAYDDSGTYGDSGTIDLPAFTITP